uniref:Uncharacterized protein n=1 Tax=Romanomermis culicivorax TaxID=13658 RepID=A0A915HRR5_ROMCU
MYNQGGQLYFAVRRRRMPYGTTLSCYTSPHAPCGASNLYALWKKFSSKLSKGIMILNNMDNQPILVRGSKSHLTAYKVCCNDTIRCSKRNRSRSGQIYE